MSAISKGYKVRGHGLSRIPDQSTVRLEISVGQPYHEGKKLEATLKWASRFPRIVLIVGDAPQRYNMMFSEGLTEKEAYKKALHAGDEWLARNAVILNKHKVERTRWDAWRQRDDYLPTRQQVGRLYRDNNRFKEAVSNEAQEHFVRRGLDNYPLFFELTKEYLLEESAVFAVAYKELGGFSAYPGSLLDMWSMFIDDEIPGAPEGLKLAQCARLSFKRRVLRA